jgi:2-succinyl-5-enolpyruvyl-6-hydroxy-3-cyclohexene-1-carboxylate synthase
VVAGDDAGPPARVLAEKAGWPLLAGTHRAGAGRARPRSVPTGCCSAGPLAEEVERVVVFGHPTLSRPVTRLMQRDDVEVLSVPSRGVWNERPFPVAQHLGGPARRRGTRRVRLVRPLAAEDRRVGEALDALLSDEADLTPYEAAGAVARALPAGGLLVVGASNPVRDLDLMVPRYEVGGRRKTIANRGLSGIDGTVSSAVGAALGRDSTRSFALMGDVTFLHDANGLVHDVHDPEPDLTIVVVNDDGGSIFATLEQGAPEHADAFRPAVRHPARRRPGQPVRGDPHPALAGRLAARARAGARLAQRRHRGRRGTHPPGQPARPRRAHPAARATLIKPGGRDHSTMNP